MSRRAWALAPPSRRAWALAPTSGGVGFSPAIRRRGLQPRHSRAEDAPQKETDMALIEGLLQELEQEAQTTRRVLERVPNAHLGWKPHPKSYSLGQLALHIAQVPALVAELSLQSPAAPPAFVQE